MEATQHRALSELLRLGDLEDRIDSVEIDPCTPVLPGRFHIGEATSAALAAGATAAAELVAVNPPRVQVNRRHAEASLSSYAHLSFAEPKRAPTLNRAANRDVVHGFKQTGDGRWMFMHPGFAHNTQGLLDLLGQPATAGAVDEAVGTWEAAALEEEIRRLGLCSAMVRSPQEWDESMPGRMLAARPVVEVIQVADGPRPSSHAQLERPLAGCRVLDLTRVLAGPTCARTLASYGADVLRVGAAHLPSVPLFVADTGPGKRNAFLDLREAPDRAQLLSLAAQADVFSQGYRTGAMERLGFGLADLVKLRPGIVYVSINCYGHEGPWRGVPGWEQLAQTVTGMAQLHGEHLGTGTPTLQSAAVTDYTTGYLAAYGALVALARRARHGGSYWVRVSLSRTAMWMRSLGLSESIDHQPLSSDELDSLRWRTDTQWGALDLLRPAVQLEGADLRWERPPSALGQHSASFAGSSAP